jgi:hypothetical protein
VSINQPSPEGSSDSSALDREAERFLAAAAGREGLTPHQFAKKYGIVDASEERRIRKHEVPLNV